MVKNYVKFQKSDLKTISINDVDINLPDLKNIIESKSVVIAKWLIKFIESGLKNRKISVNDILPSKADFAYRLGVSIGTMQNAFRYVEDYGYVESKQCIGTLVKDYKNKENRMRKLTSKRDLASEAIKRYILTGGFKIGTVLPSSRTLAILIGFNSNTTRLALEYLVVQNILEHKYKNASEHGYIIKSLNFGIKNSIAKKTETLVNIIVKDLENYISAHLKAGDRLPSHMVLSRELKASIKTVHDALKILIDKGIILSKRGRYGSTVIRLPNDNTVSLKPETSIFAPAKDTVFYHYEKVQNIIKRMISQKYQIGEKLPSIEELSNIMDISPNTIRRALKNLANEGYIVFSRGRYGGTFIIDIPEVETTSFKWLSVNPQYVAGNKEFYKIES